jgi:hypothetical protein
LYSYPPKLCKKIMPKNAYSQEIEKNVRAVQSSHYSSCPCSKTFPSVKNQLPTFQAIPVKTKPTSPFQAIPVGQKPSSLIPNHCRKAKIDILYSKL